MGLVQNKLSGCSGVLLNSQLLLLSFSPSIYVFLNFCIFLFHHLWLYFSFWYLLGSLFGRYLTALHLNLLCLCAEKHHHRSLSSHFTLLVSIFLLICTYYPPLSICFWSSTGDRLEIMKWSIEPESSLNFPSRRPGWFTNQKCRHLPEPFETSTLLYDAELEMSWESHFWEAFCFHWLKGSGSILS